MDVINSNICRTCLTKQQTEMKPIFKIINMLKKGASVQISQDDNLPKNICNNCYERATKAYAFYCQCEQSEEILKRTYSKLSSDANTTIDDVFPSIENEIANKVLTNNHSTNSQESFHNQCLYENEEPFSNLKDEPPRVSTINSDCCKMYMPNQYPILSCKEPIQGEPNFYTNFRSDTLSSSNDVLNFDDINENQEDHEMIEPMPVKNSIENNYVPFTSKVNGCQLNIQDQEDPLRKVPCNICGKMYISKRHLRSHMRYHHRSTDLLCQTCGKRFTCIPNLKRHERIHSGKLPYVCPHCPDKKFAQSNQLKSHLLTHSKAKQHTCLQCGNSYTHKTSLRIHIRRIHIPEEEKRPFLCSICNKNYKDKKDLSQHMLIHRNERSFVCETCGKSFNRKNNLNVHELIHTGVRPFPCHFCSRAFRQKHALDTHMKIHI